MSVMTARLALLCAMLSACAGAVAQETSSPPVAARDVADLEQLVVRWWQWRVALPEMATPLKDRPGRFCDVGQPSDVWFLAGYLSTGPDSASIRRSCAVEIGKRLFVPIVTMVNYPRTEAASLTCETAKAKAKAAVDGATGLVVEIDGRPLPDLDRYRMATQACFPLFKVIGSKAAGAPAAADGYWLLLDPLPKGHHTLHLGARFGGGSREAEEFQDTTYELDVR